ncbi:hypothetical protein [Neokomagataea anthophila]|uniref:DUF768 domain-containing protein n=1 Tax=Neokomagataea anthophila TaxID=2826925 RepID=A0ABS5E489_9PROT|nr:hypothetical protein [Neokomagataea anthophila]MBR0558708.1 hypothetical protein [Neokomagataea anthophila]
MSQELLPGFKEMLQGWVLKKGPARAPQRITDADADEIARASIEALHQRVIGEGWGSLETLTQGWLVQRQKGQKPSPVGEEDFRAFTLLVLRGLSAPQGKAEEGAVVQAEEEGVEGAESEEVPEDTFRFAREHLARAL